MHEQVHKNLRSFQIIIPTEMWFFFKKCLQAASMGVCADKIQVCGASFIVCVCVCVCWFISEGVKAESSTRTCVIPYQLSSCCPLTPTCNASGWAETKLTSLRGRQSYHRAAELSVSGEQSVT